MPRVCRGLIKSVGWRFCIVLLFASQYSTSSAALLDHSGTISADTTWLASNNKNYRVPNVICI